MRISGSKAMKCSSCGKICGWKVPTGKYHYGIPEVKFQMREGCIIHMKGLRQYNYCESCKSSVN